MEPTKKIRKITFSEHYPKLDLPVFTTIRPPYIEYLPGKLYGIQIKGRVVFEALLLDVLMVSLKALNINLIQFDTWPGESRKKFLDMMEIWYHDKDFWRRNSSRMQLLLLYKEFENLKPKIMKKSKPTKLETLFG